MIKGICRNIYIFFNPCLSDLSSIHTCMFVLCWFLLAVCACIYVFVFFLSPFHSDLDCPVVWGSSGLLLFSCSLRYLLHGLSPSAFNLPLLCFHLIFLNVKLCDYTFETNTHIYIQIYIFKSHTCSFTHADA